MTVYLEVKASWIFDLHSLFLAHTSSLVWSIYVAIWISNSVLESKCRQIISCCWLAWYRTCSVHINESNEVSKCFNQRVMWRGTLCSDMWELSKEVVFRQFGDQKLVWQDFSFSFLYFSWIKLNNNATKHDVYARHNIQTEMAVMEPVSGYLSLLGWARFSTAESPAAFWGSLENPISSSPNKRALSDSGNNGDHTWTTQNIAEGVLVASDLLLLSRHPGMPLPGLLQSWLLQISAIRGDCMMQLWVTVLSKHLGHACWLQGVNASVSRDENSCACGYQVVLL